MAKLKYAPAVTPIVNEHLGCTFQPNHYGQSLFVGQKNGRTRYVTQTQRMQNLSKAVQQWRNMSAPTIAAWNLFATTYPQASRRNPAVFLTGYQLFLKRNHYRFLNEGIEADFMELPILESLTNPDVTFTIDATQNCIDVTELYLSRFGQIPQVGQFVILKVYPMASDSGQFFAPIVQTIEVLESYIDGLFVSIAFNSPSPGIMFSVYLSKVFHQSVKYAGTKVKFMGCFKPSTFLELTDTPASYAGESEKIVAVKADESGLEYVDGGGGGLTCETVILCPAIIQMQNQINANSSFISLEHDTSIPPVNYGLLYNGYCLNIDNTCDFAPDGFRLITYSEWLSMRSYVGGSSVLGGYFKEAGLLFWLTPNTGAVNSYFFNGRGSGYRASNGSFSNLYKDGHFWITSLTSTLARYMSLVYNSAYSAVGAHALNFGHPIRFVKSATGIADGVKNSVIGWNGRVYRTIVINQIEWMADNSAETINSDGSPILNITDNLLWQNALTPAYCAFNNDLANV